MTSHGLNVSTERLETLFWTNLLGLGIIRLVYNPGPGDSVPALWPASNKQTPENRHRDCTPDAARLAQRSEAPGNCPLNLRPRGQVNINKDAGIAHAGWWPYKVWPDPQLGRRQRMLSTHGITPEHDEAPTNAHHCVGKDKRSDQFFNIRSGTQFYDWKPMLSIDILWKKFPRGPYIA